jgi:uncharacterized protein (DUF983 family)
MFDLDVGDLLLLVSVQEVDDTHQNGGTQYSYHNTDNDASCFIIIIIGFILLLN